MCRPLKVFITYSHEDRQGKDDLIKHLAVMKQEGDIKVWYDNEMLPGDKWREVISNNLQASNVLLYLVSAASLASENCNAELTEVLTKITIRKVPIILEPCEWQHHRVTRELQALPTHGRPITSYSPRSKGWNEVAKGIRRIAEDPCPTISPEDESDGGSVAHQVQIGAFSTMLRRLDEAREAFYKATQGYPQNAIDYYNRGVAKYELKQHKDAIADFDKAIRLKPQYAEAYNNRGNAKFNLKSFEEAMADYDMAIKYGSQNDLPIYYNNRGHAKHDLKRYEEAIADFDEAIRLNPQYALAYLTRGNAKDEISDYQGSMADFNEAIRLNPQDAEARCCRAGTYHKLGQYEQTRADLEQALGLAKKQGKSELVQEIRDTLKRLASE